MTEFIYLEEKRLLSPETGFIMKKVACWGKTLAIFGFIGVGICLIAVLFAIFGARFMSDYFTGMGIIGGWWYIPAWIIGLVFSFLPPFFLYKACSNMRKSLASGDTLTMNKAFRSLKNYFMIQVIYIILTFAGMIVAMFALGSIL